MELYDAHGDHRDKFEILAFHDATVKSFEDLDSKLTDVSKRYWGGKQLPFPILLDATGETIKTYGIRAFPTTILIDPEGKLVGEASEEQLEQKLPALPIATRLARAMDKNVVFSFDDPPLGMAMQTLSQMAGIEIRLDSEALKNANITAETRVPYKMSGLISLRSALNLVLCAYDLTYVPDEKGLLITDRKSKETGSSQLSEPQRICAKRIEEVLDRKMSFVFKDKTLAEVAQYFEDQTQENFVLDPATRKAGTLDTKAAVSGSAKDVSLRDGLTKLLEPLRLTFVVRDEVVVLLPKSAGN